jgi:spore coat polysaccharide biosynthesis predicted glycosyltransferase SpsG
MGGGDAPNKTLQVLQSVCQLEIPCTFWVLLGEGYRHSYQDLVTSIRKDSNHEIILAKTNRSMWNVFSNCSVAILAGGLTTLEAVYAGLPTLNIFEKEDHLLATGKQLFEQGVAEDLGLFNNGSLNGLRDRLSFLNGNKSQLLQMRERSKGKIDKLGPFRIYEALKTISVPVK